MIFSLADRGSLREYLKKKFKDLSWKDKYKLSLGIADGLKYLHRLDIVHKDLVFIAHAVCIVLNLRYVMFTLTGNTFPSLVIE